MDPGYQTVMDPATIVWGALAVLVHLVAMSTQAGLALFLIGSGLRRALGGEQRKVGALQLGLGVLLAAPLLVGAPVAVSLLACAGALAILLVADRGGAGGRPARWLRATAIGCAAVTALFTLWEREDPLALVFGISGNPARLDIADPVTLEQRRKVAASCQAELFEGVVPLYVDAMNDAVGARYAAKPTRIYLIGKDGRVLYNPGLGPFGFSPDDLDEVIAEHLAQASP